MGNILHTFTHCSSVVGVHIAIHRVESGIAAPIYQISLSNRHAVAHEHFGNNELTCMKNLMLLGEKKNSGDSYQDIKPGTKLTHRA